MKSAERLLVLVADRHDRPDEHPDRRDEAHEEPCTGVCHRRNEHAETTRPLADRPSSAVKDAAAASIAARARQKQYEIDRDKGVPRRAAPIPVEEERRTERRACRRGEPLTRAPRPQGTAARLLLGEAPGRL